MAETGIEPDDEQMAAILKERISDYVDESLLPDTNDQRQNLLVTFFSAAANQLNRSNLFEAIQALEARVQRVTPVTAEALSIVTQQFERWESPRVVAEALQRMNLADEFLAQFSQHPRSKLAQLGSISNGYLHLEIKIQ